MDLGTKAVRHQEQLDFAKSLLYSLSVKCVSFEKANNIDDAFTQVVVSAATNLPDNITIYDPRRRGGKGHLKIATRIPSGIQASQDSTRTRTCSKCGKKGHDKRTYHESKGDELDGSVV